MAGSGNRSITGSATNKPKVDPGTLARTNSALPGTICVSQDKQSTDKKATGWGVWQIIRWKALPNWLGGDKDLLRKYKDAWVMRQRDVILSQAKANDIPTLLLAGIAWIEVGGDPDWIDSVAYPIRAFDHAADPILEPFTVTKVPEQTSFGNVSIQLRRAAQSLGLNFDSMSTAQRDALISCLTEDDTNINVVAKHLSDLRQIDFSYSFIWGDNQVRIVATRYNRGPDLSLTEIRKNTKHGDFILKHREHIMDLLR